MIMHLENGSVIIIIQNCSLRAMDGCQSTIKPNYLNINAAVFMFLLSK